MTKVYWEESALGCVPFNICMSDLEKMNNMLMTFTDVDQLENEAMT